MAAHRTHVIDRDAHDAADAVKALEAYGFKDVAEGKGVYVRHLADTADMTTERWVRAGDGFECYKADPSWGRPAENAPGIYQIPFAVNEAFRESSGLHPGRNPGAFDWIWPAGAVWFMYEFAGEGWRREQDEAGAERMIWEGAEGE